MQVFYDVTSISVDGLWPVVAPKVTTSVIRYAPEDSDRTIHVGAPTIHYIYTSVSVPEDAPEWVEVAVNRAATEARVALDKEQAVIGAFDARVIRQAIHMHDRMVRFVQEAVEKAARERKEARGGGAASA